MKKKLVIELLLLCVAFAGIWGIFYYLNLAPKKPSFELSLENEEKLAKIIVDDFVKQNTIASNPKLDSAMEIIHERLSKGLHVTDYDYKIRIIKNDSVINAFATLGGNIFIFSGLIKFTESPEELAAVLAHEMGHTEHRDVVDKLIRDIGLNILLSVLTGQDYILLKDIGLMITSNVFTRKQEADADVFAMDLLVKSNIDPKIIAHFFRKLNSKTKNFNDDYQFLYTHPHNNSRIKAALEYKVPTNFKATPFPVEWESVQKSLSPEKTN